MTDPLTAALDVFTPAAFAIFLVGNLFALMKYGDDTPLPYAILTGLALPLLIGTQIFFDEFLGGDLTVLGYGATVFGLATVWFIAGGCLLTAPHVIVAAKRLPVLCLLAAGYAGRALYVLVAGVARVVTAPVRLVRNRDRNRNTNAGTVEAADYSNKSGATTPTTIADLEGGDDDDDGGWNPSLPDVSLPNLSDLRGSDDSTGGYHATTRRTHTGQSTSDEGRDWSVSGVPTPSAPSMPSMPSLGGVGAGLRRRLTQRNRLPAVERVDEADN